MGHFPDQLFPVLKRLPRPSCYWVAYSGGLDSSVLLHALVDHRERLPASLKALHLDHGLQANSASWARHCRRVCAALQVPMVERTLDLRMPSGASVEAEARKARLAAYRDIMESGNLVLTAQHRDDQAETLVLQLLRGSGLSGLAAMPEVMELPPGYLARPLLDFTRAQLRDYAEIHGIEWVEDPSNAETGFDRNYLRHAVLPLLAQRWPGYTKTLSRSARHCAEAQDLIDRLADRDLELARGSRPGTLSVSALRDLHPHLCRALLRRWIRETDFSPPNSRRLERIRCEILPAARDRSPMVEWPGAEVRRYRDDLFLLPPLPASPGSTPLDGAYEKRLVLPAGLGELYLKRFGVNAAAHGAGSGDTVQVRFGATGVRCEIAARGYHKSLKNLYQEQGVPTWVRPYIPLVFVNGRLRAVGDLYLCSGNSVLGAKFRVSWTGHPFDIVFAPRTNPNHNAIEVTPCGS